MKSPNVLVCPLDWGLGHATRCIPVIKALIETGARVIIASDGAQQNLLRSEFPDIEFITFKGYQIRYSKILPVTVKILFDLPRIISRIKAENKELKALIRHYKIDIVISDNRYGLWNKNIYTVIITHQLKIIPPLLLKPFGKLLHNLTRSQLLRFNECWIPDYAGEPNLSGELSHGKNLPSNSRYIGLLSRFDSNYAQKEPAKSYKIVAILSGPEPQRTIFEMKIRAQLLEIAVPCLIVRGLPGNTGIRKHNSFIDIADHMNTNEFAQVLLSKPLVISRAGYSTLMDIAFTGNKAILVPTPGQTEQEYLAKKLSEAGIFYTTTQNNLNLKRDCQMAQNFSGIRQPEQKDSYKFIIKELINRFRQ
ncbi:MAG: hypothetical protein K0B15_06205 [Lentimicrobium sp.]|nr:hypothetical protein [Lentimicrobium sp.]